MRLDAEELAVAGADLRDLRQRVGHHCYIVVIQAHRAGLDLRDFPRKIFDVPSRNAELEPDDCQPLREGMERGEVEMFARVRGQYPGTPLEEGRLPGLRTVGYWDAVGPQSWGLPMHRNEGIEICYLLSGETAFATDHESVLLRPGDITITRPWQRHRLAIPTSAPAACSGSSWTWKAAQAGPPGIFPRGLGLTQSRGGTCSGSTGRINAATWWTRGWP